MRQAKTSREETVVTDFQAALLILVSRNPNVSPSEIAEWIDRGNGGLLGRSAAHMYTEIKRLARLGYLQSDGPEIRHRGRSPKARYWISPQGNDAIHEWLRSTAAALPATDDSELSTRVRALHVGGEDVVWQGLRDLPFQIEDRRDLLNEREREMRRAGVWEGRGTLDDRLQIDLARRLLGAYEDWIEVVRRELDQLDPRASEAPNPSSSRSGAGARRPRGNR
jgi:DNA-binding PadR family transcriptional regulator